ncbi:endo-1,4-beta-xylanase [Terriglobus roseus]|uniref:Beta-xylanase n=1 Tax=Terriglobus roseus TaxID=392734 RepID=A0A1G7ID61_9BACT|nr:endo-1,4-beta-xylanase [Terriglobus roseus]SDF10289.1 endo-1,4-beta-xylanase [Terriglobus roseus]
MPDSRSFSRRELLQGASVVATSAAMTTLTGCGPKRMSGSAHGLPGVDVSGPHSLKAHAMDARMLFGFAVNIQKLRDDAGYRALVEQQCSIIVAENAMKWQALRPAIDQFSFADADALVEFASRRHIRLRGHNLCWHEALPEWFSRQVTAVNARQLLREHIRTVAGRYAGRMHSWDVVNEAIEVKDGRPDGLRNTPWLQLIGTDYIEMAFRVARDADPSALLTYNEYGIEQETQEAAMKRAAVLLMLRRLKQRNVPLDAVGIQSHLQAQPAYGYGAGLRRFVQDCREIGLEVFVTELDVNDRTLPSDVSARDIGVASRYRSYLDLLLPERNVTAVLTWGVSDDGTWLNNGKDRAREDGLPQRPLLFDDHLRAKPAFVAVRDAFDARRQTGALRSTPTQQKPLPKL